MDRVYEKEKSSRKTRDEKDRDRDSSKDHHRDRDRDREHRYHHHRSSKDVRLRESEERHHSDKYREEKQRSSKDEKHREEDRHRLSRDYEESKRERSYEPRNERESREDRVLREESVERRSSHKRKERAESEDRLDKSEKRSKSSKEEKREKRGFEDKGVESLKEEKREKRKFEDKDVQDSRDLNGYVKEEREQRDENGDNNQHGKRERRRFGDKVKEDDVRAVEEEKMRVSDVKLEKKQSVGERAGKYTKSTVSSNGSNSKADGAALDPLNMTSSAVPEPSSKPSHLPHPTKVSSIYTTNENKGVSVTRSHEVPGKSSTDGTTASAAGKSGSLSLDALAKAKKALQMQKELSEKLKKIPQLNKTSTSHSDGTSQLGLNKEGPKAQQGSVALTTASAAYPAQALTSTSALPVAGSSSSKPSASGVPALPGLTAVPNIEAVKRAQELAAKMGFHHDPEFAPLINMFPGQMPADATAQPKPAKAPVLRLDALGREIDEHGNVINVAKPANLSTLKVNINKQKKEAFQILKPELEVDPESNPHFDPDMGINKTKLLRPKRMSFQFVEEGSWAKQAEIIKFKSQFGEAQAKELKTKQAQLAKAKAEPDINPNLIEVSERVIIKEKPKDPIPEVEWWDVPLLPSGTYGEITEGSITEDKLKMDKLTIYVEHPLPIEPPAEPAPPPPQPLKLTKKEQKKLRTQRRLAKEKDKQEMIRQGVIEPPKPKVKMSNLMKVLGSEATQDPTRLEMEIRSAAAEREQAHVDRNIARKLTPAERREKKERKLFEDPNTLETIVSVYKINDLSHPQTRFKVDVNAQENRLTGCAVIGDSMCVVVVEGGSKSIKRYGKLMLRRINWAAAVPDEEEEDENEDKPVNKCVLVWQGSVAKPSFNRFLVHQCRTEAAARKVFSDAGVAHYWDLSINFKDDDM